MPHEGEQPGAPLRSAVMQCEETDTDVQKKKKKKEKECNKADLHLCHQMCKVNVVCNIHKCESMNTRLHPWATDLTSTF